MHEGCILDTMVVKDKIAIVTGASSGIGLATAKLLSKKGAKVVLAARSKDKLESLSKDLPGSLAVLTDVREVTQIKQLVELSHKHFGRIDILINNAGRGYDSLIENVDIKNFQELFELNLRAPLILMQEVIPIMRKQKGGSIINISSGTSLMAIPTVGTYSALKRGLNGLTLTAREELKKDNINVSVVYPYITKTSFYKNIMGKPRKTVDVRGNDNLPPPDTAQDVAEKILYAIENEEAEVFAHEWMKNGR